MIRFLDFLTLHQTGLFGLLKGKWLYGSCQKNCYKHHSLHPNPLKLATTHPGTFKKIDVSYVFEILNLLLFSMTLSINNNLHCLIFKLFLSLKSMTFFENIDLNLYHMQYYTFLMTSAILKT